MDTAGCFPSLSAPCPTYWQCLSTSCPLQTSCHPPFRKTTIIGQIRTCRVWQGNRKHYHIILSVFICLFPFHDSPTLSLCRDHCLWQLLISKWSFVEGWVGGGGTKQTGQRERTHYSDPSADCSNYRLAHSISQPVKYSLCLSCTSTVTPLCCHIYNPLMRAAALPLPF